MPNSWSSPLPVNVVRDQLEASSASIRSNQSNRKPGEPFENPDNQTITDFEGLDATFYDGVRLT